MRSADVVKLNRDEVSTLAELLAFGSAEPRRFAGEVLGRYRVRLVCVTRGAEGCLAVAPDEIVDVPGRRVEVADAVGAGDAFTAALVCGLLRGWPLQRTVPFANEVGALVAGRPGAMPILKDELERLVH